MMKQLIQYIWREEYISLESYIDACKHSANSADVKYDKEKCSKKEQKREIWICCLEACAE